MDRLVSRLVGLEDIFQYWLDWNLTERQREGLDSGPDTNVMTVPPHWPTRGNIAAWVEVLKAARAVVKANEPRQLYPDNPPSDEAIEAAYLKQQHV